MLEDWKRKFPQCFKDDPTISSDLNHGDQLRLSDLLTTIEVSGALNEYIVGCLLEKSRDYLDALVYLIGILSTYHCLNQQTLNSILGCHFLRELQENIQTAWSFFPPSADFLTFLLSTSAPVSCAQFIICAGKAGVDFEFIKHFLTQHIAIRGLDRAMTLFDFSGFEYSKVHLPQLSILASVLANPLCKTIFDARLRCFSDYSLPHEPVDDSVSQEIIQQLSALKGDEEDKIRLFFDFFAQFRPLPESQKYLVEIDMATLVTAQLEAYCELEIDAIKTDQDYLQVRKMIITLQTVEGRLAAFDNIKYAVASAVESEDFCSNRGYDQLMADISEVLSQPQIFLNLERSIARLEASKGYLQLASAAMRQHSLLMRSQEMSSADPDDHRDPKPLPALY